MTMSKCIDIRTGEKYMLTIKAVSYTHLTLPTIA